MKNRIPELWNPYTAEILPCPVYQTDNEGIKIPLELPPAGSLFVVFRKTNETSLSKWDDFKYNGVSIFSTQNRQGTLLSCSLILVSPVG